MDTHETHDIFRRFECKNMLWRHLWRKQFLVHVHAFTVIRKRKKSGRQLSAFHRRCRDSIRGGRFPIFVDEVVTESVLLRVRRFSFIIYHSTSVSYSSIFHSWWCNRPFNGCSVEGLYQPYSGIKYKSKVVSVHAVKAYSESSTTPLILKRGTRWTWWVKLTLRPLYSLVKTSVTHLMGGCEEPRPGLDFVGVSHYYIQYTGICDVVSELIVNWLRLWEVCFKHVFIIIMLSFVKVFSSCYFFWTNGDPHSSGFKFQTAILSVLCMMFLV